MIGGREAHELRSKYVEMLAMRLAHSAGYESATVARARMIALAARFPGALREIDDLELVELRSRISKLEAVMTGVLDAEPWMQAMSLFHKLARGALGAKRWLGGNRRVDAETERAYAAHVAALDDPEDGLAWVGQLGAIASPPGGRVMALVYARMGCILGVPESRARHLVFGEPKRHRHPDRRHANSGR